MLGGFPPECVTPPSPETVTPHAMPKPPAGRPAGIPKPYRRSGSKQWWVKVKVPKGAGGPRQVARSLRTPDLAEANRRAPLVVAEIRAEIEALRRHPDGTRKDHPGDPSAEQRKTAEWWAKRRVPDPLRPGFYRIPEGLGLEWDAEIDRTLGDPIGEGPRNEPLYAPERAAAASVLFGLTTGEVVPVAYEVDRYIRQEGLKPSYASRTRSAVRRLSAWLLDHRIGDNIHAVTGRRADEFADAVAPGITTATLNSLLSALSAYWRWMKQRRLVSENPWQGQQRKVVSRQGNAEKRPFTDAEVKALLSGPASLTLHDMMRLAALSGLRLSEIGNLRAGDVVGGVFKVRAGKTAAAIRDVPVHPDLAALVRRRMRDKSPDAFLIEELTAPPSRPGRRGGKIGERFTAYRRRLELDARPAGRRQADADFHSFRRYFITKAEQAGQPEPSIRSVVGHQREGITLGRYSGGPSKAQLQRVVRSVRLPAGTPASPPDRNAGTTPP